MCCNSPPNKAHSMGTDASRNMDETRKQMAQQHLCNISKHTLCASGVAWNPAAMAGMTHGIMIASENTTKFLKAECVINGPRNIMSDGVTHSLPTSPHHLKKAKYAPEFVALTTAAVGPLGSSVRRSVRHNDRASTVQEGRWPLCLWLVPAAQFTLLAAAACNVK